MTYKVKLLLTWLVSSLFCVVGFVGVLFGYGNYTLSGFSNACFIPSFVFLCIVGLIFCSRCGAFDTFSYGFIAVGNSFSKDPTSRKYKDMHDYKEKKTQKRKNSKPSYLALLIPPVLMFMAFIVLTIIINAVGY